METNPGLPNPLKRGDLGQSNKSLFWAFIFREIFSSFNAKNLGHYERRTVMYGYFISIVGVKLLSSTEDAMDAYEKQLRTMYESLDLPVAVERLDGEMLRVKNLDEEWDTGLFIFTEKEPIVN